MSFYYLVASLPTLVLGEPAPIARSEVPVRFANLLPDEEKAELSLVLEGREGESANAFLRRWRHADAQLRNAVARVRAGKLAVELRDYQHEHEGYSLAIEKGVTDAYAKPNPLERELALDRLRWELLDELVFPDRFSFAAVLAWAIKLRLAERWAGLTEEKGRKNFEDMVRAGPGGETQSPGSAQNPKAG